MCSSVPISYNVGTIGNVVQVQVDEDTPRHFCVALRQNFFPTFLLCEIVSVTRCVHPYRERVQIP